MSQISFSDKSQQFKIDSNKEVWKPVVGYEGQYIVSSNGKVYSIPRKIWNGKGYIDYKGKEIKQVFNHKGYPCVYLSKKAKDYYCLVHRLVAKAFIPNPENKSQINHINGIKTDNRVENLEWCSNQENQIHAWALGLQKVSGKAGRPKKKVLQIDIKTKKIVAEYDSIKSASNAVGAKTSSNIGSCCRNAYGRKTTKGYEWKFKEEGGDAR